MIEQVQPRIRVLDAHIANKIAAGEVIERPASVVKELVENALDAHATRIEVHVEDGGRKLLRVVDDGWGMGPEDLAAAFLPHATSKLGDVDDLERIATLGFRGEALASIGSVSHARIVSRERGQASGHAVENRGGEITPPKTAGAAEGTDVTVRHLFFNTPARAKFLRTPRTEWGHVEDWVRRCALAFPEVGFRLLHDGAEALAAPPAQSRAERLASLFGRELAGRLLPVVATPRGARCEGFLGPPDLTRPHARDLHFFVNGRAIRDKILHRVVKDAYRDVVHHGRHPVVFLFLEMDPAQIDVNVHPTKAEVRWRDASFLHRVVGPALARTLRDADFATRLEGGAGAVDGAPAHPRAAGIQDAMADFLRRHQDDGGDAVRTGPPRAYGGGGLARPGAEPLSVFQVHDAYLVCEVEDGLAIVDQHALHERVQYDRIVAKLAAGGVEAQRLLVPEQVELTAAETGVLAEHAELLRRCGFEWSPFGDGAVAVETIPAVIPRECAGDLLRDLADLLRNRGGDVDAKLLFHDVADTMACKAAIRFGDRISREEARALLEESRALDAAFVCPHGRPTVLRLPFAELERRFGRR